MAAPDLMRNISVAAVPNLLIFRLPYNIQIQKTGARDAFSAAIHARF
jgi:hypothetical protein